MISVVSEFVPGHVSVLGVTEVVHKYFDKNEIELTSEC